jgi:4-amino-4-deoxy-L-arabinose transferase-like glycosyltransferase
LGHIQEEKAEKMKFFEETSSTSERYHPYILVLLMAALVLTWILRMNFWDQPFEMDEGAYGYMGWGILNGLVPYKDMYDQKPPGIFVLNSLVFLLFEPTALNVKIFASIYSLGSVLAVFMVTRKLAGREEGCLAALLYAIFSCGPHIQGGGVNSEVFMVLPYTLAAYSLLKLLETGSRKSYLYFGFWTSVACTIKQVALVNFFWLASYLVIRIWQRRQLDTVTRVLSDGFLVVIGAVIPWVPFLLYFYGKDALDNFYFWQVSFNLHYIATGHQGIDYFYVFLAQMKSVFSENGFLWLAALAGIGYRWPQRLKNVETSKHEAESWQYTAWKLMAIWPIFSFIGVALGGRFFPHYFIQIVPSLAVLGGVGLMDLMRKVRGQGIGFFRRPTGFGLVLLLALSFLSSVKADAPYYLKYNGMQISLRQYNTPLFSVTRYIGKYLRGRTERDDLIYVWGVSPEINFYALRKSPNPYLMHTIMFYNLPWDSYKEVLESLHRSPPKYVVAMWQMSIFPALQDYVEENYRLETTEDLELLKKLMPFEIYLREE